MRGLRCRRDIPFTRALKSQPVRVGVLSKARRSNKRHRATSSFSSHMLFFFFLLSFQNSFIVSLFCADETSTRTHNTNTLPIPLIRQMTGEDSVRLCNKVITGCCSSSQSHHSTPNSRQYCVCVCVCNSFAALSLHTFVRKVVSHKV